MRCIGCLLRAAVATEQYLETVALLSLEKADPTNSSVFYLLMFVIKCSFNCWKRRAFLNASAALHRAVALMELQKASFVLF